MKNSYKRFYLRLSEALVDYIQAYGRVILKWRLDIVGLRAQGSNLSYC